MYRQVLNHYVSRARARIETTPRSWARDERGCRKPKCQECKILAEFLASTTETFIDFKCKSSKSKYLYEQIEHDIKDGYLSTKWNKTGSLGILIWKTAKMSPFECPRASSGSNEIAREIRGFKQERLKVLLGDFFDSIRAGRPVDLIPRCTPSSSQAGNPTRAYSTPSASRPSSSQPLPSSHGPGSAFARFALSLASSSAINTQLGTVLKRGYEGTSSSQDQGQMKQQRTDMGG
ncbi:hypothetical protein BDZ45DRAFT_753143 [Acephala macrosclerotiorum]|nr:hypothetical protein BDZ45DRAFT_753143 [Acephala macrosclerotiorum]